MVKLDDNKDVIDPLAFDARSTSKLVNYNIMTMFIKLVLNKISKSR